MRGQGHTVTDEPLVVRTSGIYASATSDFGIVSPPATKNLRLGYERFQLRLTSCFGVVLAAKSQLPFTARQSQAHSKTV